LRVAALLIVVSAALAPTVQARESRDYAVPFRMPRGEIYCAYQHYSFAPIGIRCEIRSLIRPLPPRPKGCRDAVWGAGYFLPRAGRASVLCIADTVYDPKARVLAYGTTYRVGGFICSSKATGLTCKNVAGRGFFISPRHSYAI
jgi:hypothetical protein